MKIRIGTRGSDLARTQSETIAAALTAAGAHTELVVIRTAGDRSQAASFTDIGPQGVFVREIEQALLAHEIDVAVHSYKDLPSVSPAGLVIAAVPARYDVADMLVLGNGAHDPAAALGLRQGASIGTASVRRQTWLAHMRPDLDVSSLRGNVPTRLKHLGDGRFDAILLAAAGLERLRASPHGDATRTHLQRFRLERLDPAVFVPAPSQGALAIQCRADDAALRDLLAGIEHAPTRATVAAERALLARIQGGCDVPFGAYCEAQGDGYRMWTMFELAGAVHTRSVAGPDPLTLADTLWQQICAQRGA
jgi:hydroxymethylbilane synthase